jgi:hypothetical protein
VGVDLDSAVVAIEGEQRRRRGSATAEERPLDRIESELLRVLIADPSSVEGVTEADFTDERLRSAFSAIVPAIATTRPGEPVAIPTATGDDTASLLRSLAMDDRPLPSGSEIKARIEERRLDAEIADLQRNLAAMEPGSEVHSDNLRRLIALQQEKRSSSRL